MVEHWFCLVLVSTCPTANDVAPLCWQLIAMGSNSLILYVMAMNYRWYLVAAWVHLIGGEIFYGSWQLILSAFFCLLSLMILAAA